MGERKEFSLRFPCDGSNFRRQEMRGGRRRKAKEEKEKKKREACDGNDFRHARERE